MQVSLTSQYLYFARPCNPLAARCPTQNISFKRPLAAIEDKRKRSCRRLLVLSHPETLDFQATRCWDRREHSIQFGCISLLGKRINNAMEN